MESVDPIRNLKKIDALKKYLLGTGNVRNYALIVFGMNSALRITDILSLTWNQVYDFENDKLKSHATIREKKTNKNKQFFLNRQARDALSRLMDSLDGIKENDFIFKSRQGNNKPITRVMAANIVKDSAKAVGIKGRIGCHSLRKTFGYWSWKKGVPLALLCDLFNYSNQSITKRYLGISQDDIDDVYKLVEL